MSLELRSIMRSGDIKNERITLRANSSLDLGDYVLLQTGFNGKEVTIDVHNAFWFPYYEVRIGDLVVLYTRPGNESKKLLKSGSNHAHFFFWGLDSTIWNDEYKAAVIIRSIEWAFRSAKDLSA